MTSDDLWSQPNDVTKDHIIGFGLIIYMSANIECIFDEALAAILRLRPEHAAIVMGILRYEQKRDLLRTLVHMADVPDELETEFSKLIERADKKITKIRKYVAHCIWGAGRKPGHIKPYFINARGNLRLLGVSHNEKEYSAKDLKQEAAEIQKIGRQMLEFMNQHGLRVTIAKNTAETSASTSSS